MVKLLPIEVILDNVTFRVLVLQALRESLLTYSAPDCQVLSVGQRADGDWVIEVRPLVPPEVVK